MKLDKRIIRRLHRTALFGVVRGAAVALGSALVAAILVLLPHL